MTQLFLRVVCHFETRAGMGICGAFATEETAATAAPRCAYHSTRQGDRPGDDLQREVPAGLEAGEEPRDVARKGAGADLKANSCPRDELAVPRPMFTGPKGRRKKASATNALRPEARPTLKGPETT